MLYLLGKRCALGLDRTFAGVSRGHPEKRVSRHEGVHTAFHDL